VRQWRKQQESATALTATNSKQLLVADGSKSVTSADGCVSLVMN